MNLNEAKEILEENGYEMNIENNFEKEPVKTIEDALKIVLVKYKDAFDVLADS